MPGTTLGREILLLSADMNSAPSSIYTVLLVYAKQPISKNVYICIQCQCHVKHTKCKQSHSKKGPPETRVQTSTCLIVGRRKRATDWSRTAV